MSADFFHLRAFAWLAQVQTAQMAIATVLMIQVVGFSSVILPYQAAPVVIGMQMGGVSMGQGAKLTLVLTFLTVVLLVPLNYLWWLALGKF